MRAAELVRRVFTGTLPPGLVDELSAVAVIFCLSSLLVVGLLAAGVEVGKSMAYSQLEYPISLAVEN